MMLKKSLTVKKDNALIAASYNFTLAEQRLILLAVAQGQDAVSDMHQVTATAFADAYGVALPTAYENLKAAAMQLFERRFSWVEKTPQGKTKHVHARWVSRVGYIDGFGHVEVRFSEDVLPLLAELQSRFTVYSLEQVANLTSTHAVRLYELLIAWRSTGKTPVYPLAEFREQLGIFPEEYPRMTDFKRRVLDAAIKQVNEHTDILAEYHQEKQGRSISGFSFTFTPKTAPARDPYTVDMLTGSTDAETSGKPQRKVISKSKAESMARPGESWHDLFLRLSREYIIK